MEDSAIQGPAVCTDGEDGRIHAGRASILTRPAMGRWDLALLDRVVGVAGQIRSDGGPIMGEPTMPRQTVTETIFELTRPGKYFTNPDR